LGNLFGTKGKQLNRSKLLIFVTSHIIDPSGSKFSEEVQHLRDNARVALTAEGRAREAAREALDAELAAQRAEERAAEEVSTESDGERSSRTGFGGRRRR
jgi:type II secretory pathway component GspD/PulD (secretin)